MPKLRHGSSFLAWLLERRERAEDALSSVVVTGYPIGDSTRRMDELVTTSDTSSRVTRVRRTS